jgi:hypothetical protein
VTRNAPISLFFFNSTAFDLGALPGCLGEQHRGQCTFNLIQLSLVLSKNRNLFPGTKKPITNSFAIDPLEPREVAFPARPRNYQNFRRRQRRIKDLSEYFRQFPDRAPRTVNGGFAVFPRGQLERP